MEIQQHFEEVRKLIRHGQRKALQAAYSEQLATYWQIGAYVHYRLQNAEWGEKTIDELARWLKKKEPTLKGFSRRSLYRMREFYQTWHESDWNALRKDGTSVPTSPTQLQNTDDQSLHWRSFPMSIGSKKVFFQDLQYRRCDGFKCSRIVSHKSLFGLWQHYHNPNKKLYKEIETTLLQKCKFILHDILFRHQG